MLELLATTRAAVALDTPGFGQSFRPEGRPSAREYGRWLLDAVDALGIDRFHLCAHHNGTHFAAEIALLAPARVRSLLLSGVLHAAPPCAGRSVRMSALPTRSITTASIWARLGD